MVISTETECRTYVERELARLAHEHPKWHGSPVVTASRPTQLAWIIGPTLPLPGEPYPAGYRLEADVARQEFVIRFGHHQVGLEGLHWILRPAVHVAFADLSPRDDPLAIRHSLSSVLAHMIETLALPRSFAMRFDLPSDRLT